jgi:hypothetical protein
MAGTATAALTAALRTTAAAGLSEALFRNNELMPLFAPAGWEGGATKNYKIHYGGNSSVSTYAEGDALGVAGSQSYLTANFPEKHYRATISITGHVYDQTQGGNQTAVFFDQAEKEFTYATKDLVDLITTDMLGTGVTAPVGIQGIVDSAGTLAGIDPNTYTWWAAYENTSSTTIAVADIDTALQNVRDPEYAANINLILTSHKQMMKAKGVFGNPGQTSNSVRTLVSAGGYVMNLVDYTNMAVGGIPVIPLRDLTNSIWMGVEREQIEIATQRPLNVVPLAKNDDSDRWLMTWAGGLTTRNRMKAFKLTGFSA